VNDLTTPLRKVNLHDRQKKVIL